MARFMWILIIISLEPAILNGWCDHASGFFKCARGDCIPEYQRCDGNNDCHDWVYGFHEGSDERNCLYRESCDPGYRLEFRKCYDINECREIPLLCDHHCKNELGTYSCSCEKGYVLQPDNSTCKVPKDQGDVLLVFSSKTEIHGFNLSANESYSPIIKNLTHAGGVSLDSTHVYWSDVKSGDGAIFRAFMNGTAAEVIAIAGIGKPEEIAVDWVTGNIYFTDSLYQRIGACTNSGSHCTIIMHKEIEKPRGLALNPATGRMYWSDWGEKPHIFSAEMDGKLPDPIVLFGLGWPNGLTIDYPASRLYWVDAKMNKIVSINLDGGDRRTLSTITAFHPFSIAIFENSLFWSDWRTKSIRICNKNTGEGQETLLQENEEIYGIHIHHPVLKPNLSNPCNAHPCQEICLLAAYHKYTCACSPDKTLEDNKKSCKPIKYSNQLRLIIATGDNFFDYRHEILGKPHWERINTAHQFAEVYDSINQNLFSNNNRIKFDEISRILGVNETVGEVALDYIGNNLYSTDFRHKRIEIMSLSTLKKTVLHFSEEPKSILLIPELSIMFVTFCGTSKCHIDRMTMTGSGRIQFLKDMFRGPRVPLAFDAETKRVFWADQGMGRMQSVSLDGRDRQLLHSGLIEPVSLAVLGEEVIWTLKNSKKIFWSSKNKSSTGMKEFDLTIPTKGDIMHLMMISANKFRQQSSEKRHKCQVDNGGCSHVCLVESPQSHVCKCPPDMILNSDKKTCMFELICLNDEFKCSDDHSCINKTRLCDGVEDCYNGADEKNCTKCAAEEFTCGNLKCIPKLRMCDNSDDCGDNSDEENCDSFQRSSSSASLIQDPTPCPEFKCNSSGRCLQYRFVCDSQSHCYDSSDEGKNCSTPCSDDSCDHLCLRTPSGPTCRCRTGYRLTSDNKTCEDIDECQGSSCSQVCHNTVGSFECSCFTGYILQDDRTTCKVIEGPMVFITATKDKIRRISSDPGIAEVVHRQPQGEITGLDVNVNKSLLYWTSELLGTIHELNLETMEHKIIANIGRPRVLAVDWIADKIYYLDVERPEVIQACSFNETKPALIARAKNSGNISSFAVEPKAGWLFWGQTNSTDGHNPSSEIWRSDLDGRNLMNIAKALGVVSGITIDHERSMLYWVDDSLQAVERARLDGSSREVFLKQIQIQMPVTINIYGDWIYSLMGGSGALQKCSLEGERICVPVSMTNNYGHELFVISHGSRQPVGNTDPAMSTGRFSPPINTSPAPFTVSEAINELGRSTDGVLDSGISLQYVRKKRKQLGRLRRKQRKNLQTL